MNTLILLLSGSITYDSNWAIYAQRINGEFKPESPARFGQRSFENGGILDGCELFVSNEQVCERRALWFGTFSEGLKEMSQIEMWESAYESANDDVDWCDSVRSNSIKLESVIEWVQSEHPDWYEEAYQEWEDTNDSQEVAIQLIDEMNELL